MATTSMNIRMDGAIKEQAKELFSELGMDMTTAINLFLRQAILQQGIPFELRLPVPNAMTIAAIKEAESQAKIAVSEKTYQTAEDMVNDILA